MKLLINIIAASGLVLAVAACDSETPAPRETPPETPTDPIEGCGNTDPDGDCL